MKKKLFSVLSVAAIAATTVFAIPAGAADIGRATLGSKDGWGAFGSGTTGGSTASTTNVYTVKNRKELVDALKAGGTNPKIIYISGTINMNVDDNNNPLTESSYITSGYTLDKYLAAYDPAVWGRSKVPSGTMEDARSASAAKQKARVTATIPSNTTIVNATGTTAVIKGGSFNVTGASNVIIRNIEFQDTFDYFPQWDPTDGSTGNWNSAYDSVTISNSTNVWVDHCFFNDGTSLDKSYPTYFGRKYQKHDGALDVVNGANYVTLSYNKFENHDKTTIIGNSDSKTTDDGKLKVTMHHNYYKDVVQRVPRTRFGQVHIYNNYYEGSTSASAYPYSYTWGIGYSSKIYAENNYFSIAGVSSADKLGSVMKGTTLFDTGTVLNGTNVNISSALKLSTNVGWTPSLKGTVEPTSSVPASVKANAGTGKL